MSADGRLMLQVCLCTHNPRPETFHKVLTALRHQTQRTCFELVLVDNASNPPIEEWMCRNALGDEIPLRIERERTLGIAAARIRAGEATTADWILFVDDDTELSPDYIEQGLRIIADNPTIGCFGGKLVLPDYLSPARWMRPLLPFLAIKDLGNEAVTSVADEWRHCEPPTAGAFVRRSVLNRYLAMMRANQLAPSLGRNRSSRGMFWQAFWELSHRSVLAARSAASRTRAVLAGLSTCRQYRTPAASRQLVFTGCLRKASLSR